MNQQQIETIDIERCKELFEYEMTEVVLMLKGEFATVSGKDLGLSQHPFGEGKQMAPAKDIFQKPIPSVEVQKFGISEGLTQKPTIPMGTICDKNNTDKANTQEAHAIKLSVALPSQKPIVCPHALTLPPVELSQQVAIPEVMQVRVPQCSIEERTFPQVALPSAVEVPKVNLPEASVSRSCVNVPSAPQFHVNVPKADMPETAMFDSAIDIPQVPHFNVNAPQLECRPVAVEVPGIKAFARIGESVQRAQASEEMPSVVCHVPKHIAVPKLPATSLLVSEIPAGLVSLPKIDKVPMPKVSQAPADIGTGVAIPATITNMKTVCTNFSDMSFSLAAKLEPSKEMRNDAVISVPVKPVVINGSLPEVVLPKQQCAVPKIPRIDAVQPSETVAMQNATGIELPEVPDIQRELEEMRSIVVK